MKPIDISKFKKELAKNDTVSVGFNDPKYWVSTGSYALNYLIRSDFNKGIPLGKVTMFAGESGCLPENAIVEIKSIVDYKHIEKNKVTIKELKQKYTSNRYSDIKINTPDGYQPITEWFDKGPLKMVLIRTESGLRTICAVNHLLQTAVVHPSTNCIDIVRTSIGANEDTKYNYIEGYSYSWMPAMSLDVGDFVLTQNKQADKITEVHFLPDPVECYDFTIDHDNHRYWGDGFSSHNSGKSFLASGNIASNAQKNGYFVVLIDTENALDENWLKDLNVDTSEDKLMRISVCMVDDVAKIISDFMKGFKDQYATVSREERPKVLFVIDSLGMLLTNTDVKQFEEGDMKGDMGRKPKALTSLVRNCVNMFGEWDVGLVVTNHTYASQNMFDPSDKISGGSGFVYASSIVLAMRKLNLKEDEEGNKITEIRGIRCQIKCMKTRYNKPFETCEIKIPWDTGMDPFCGLVDLFESKGLLNKEGHKLKYISLDGTERKYSRKNITDEFLTHIMNEFDEQMKRRDILKIEQLKQPKQDIEDSGE